MPESTKSSAESRACRWKAFLLAACAAAISATACGSTNPTGDHLLMIVRASENVIAYNVEQGASEPLPFRPSGEVRWSPNGSRAAFLKDLRHRVELIVFDRDDRLIRRVTSFTATFTYPSWSPDGGRLSLDACERDQRTSGERCGIYVVDVRHRTSRLVSHEHSDTAPSWAPDGTRLAVARAEHGIRVIELATGRVRRLTDAFDIDPQWSPAEMTIAFLRIDRVNREDHGTIYLISAGGKGLRRVTPPSVDVEEGFDFSPDGQEIAFVARTRARAICEAPVPVAPLSILDLATGRSQQLTANNGSYSSPQWSPDGALIAVNGWTCDTARHAFPWTPHVIGSDGRHFHRAPDGESFAWMPEHS